MLASQFPFEVDVVATFKRALHQHVAGVEGVLFFEASGIGCTNQLTQFVVTVLHQHQLVQAQWVGSFIGHLFGRNALCKLRHLRNQTLFVVAQHPGALAGVYAGGFGVQIINAKALPNASSCAPSGRYWRCLDGFRSARPGPSRCWPASGRLCRRCAQALEIRWCWCSAGPL